MKFSQIRHCFVLASLWASTGSAQSIVAPFHPIQLDQNQLTEHKELFEVAKKTTESALLDSSQPLSSLEKKMPLGNNHDRLATDFSTDLTQSKKPIPIKTRIYQPGLCYIEHIAVFFVTASNLADDQLMSVGSRSLERSTFQANDPNSAQLFEELYQQAASEAKTKADTYESIIPANAFKAKFHLKHNTTRLDQGSLQCLNLITAGYYATKYKIIHLFGGEQRGLIRNHFGIKPYLSRSTRSFQISYNMLNSTDNVLTFETKVSASEAVFGQSIPMSISGPIQISTDRRRIIYQPLKDLTNFINEEVASLGLKDNPKISRVYGAWVYVDKGRAWGLKMNDRLVLASDTSEIKGHVIGYYGPQHKIKSPSGHLVHEGAIVFIRKGQRKTRIGQELTFDAKKFPAPLPNLK